MLRSLTDKQKAATFYGITFALAVTAAVFGPGSPDLIQMLYMLTPTIGVLLLLLVLTPEGYHRSSWAGLAMHRAGWRGWLPALVVPTAILAAVGRVTAGARAVLAVLRSTQAPPTRQS